MQGVTGELPEAVAMLTNVRSGLKQCPQCASWFRLAHEEDDHFYKEKSWDTLWRISPEEAEILHLPDAEYLPQLREVSQVRSASLAEAAAAYAATRGAATQVKVKQTLESAGAVMITFYFRMEKDLWLSRLLVRKEAGAFVSVAGQAQFVSER